MRLKNHLILESHIRQAEYKNAQTHQTAFPQIDRRTFAGLNTERETIV
jgi:hypothetical protein